MKGTGSKNRASRWTWTMSIQLLTTPPVMETNFLPVLEAILHKPIGFDPQRLRSPPEWNSEWNSERIVDFIATLEAINPLEINPLDDDQRLSLQEFFSCNSTCFVVTHHNVFALYIGRHYLRGKLLLKIPHCAAPRAVR